MAFQVNFNQYTTFKKIALSIDLPSYQYGFLATNVTISAVITGTVPPGTTYLWQQISGNNLGITFTSPTNGLTLTYTNNINQGGTFDDKTFRFWVNKGTSYQQYKDYIVYGTPITYPHLTRTPLTYDQNYYQFNYELTNYPPLNTLVNADQYLSWRLLSNPNNYKISSIVLQQYNNVTHTWDPVFSSLTVSYGIFPLNKLYRLKVDFVVDSSTIVTYYSNTYLHNVYPNKTGVNVLAFAPDSIVPTRFPGTLSTLAGYNTLITTLVNYPAILSDSGVTNRTPQNNLSLTGYNTLLTALTHYASILSDSNSPTRTPQSTAFISGYDTLLLKPFQIGG